jgi:hypothetical protein
MFFLLKTYPKVWWFIIVIFPLHGSCLRSRPFSETSIRAISFFNIAARRLKSLVASLEQLHHHRTAVFAFFPRNQGLFSLRVTTKEAPRCFNRCLTTSQVVYVGGNGRSSTCLKSTTFLSRLIYANCLVEVEVWRQQFIGAILQKFQKFRREPNEHIFFWLPVSFSAGEQGKNFLQSASLALSSRQLILLGQLSCERWRLRPRSWQWNGASYPCKW